MLGCFLLLPGISRLYGQTAELSRPMVYMVSNAHLDTQWNWDVQTTIEEYIPKTIERNLFLLDRYPDYIINFEGGIKYAWMKEYYPHLYDRVKDYVAQGRWHISGSTWDANDPNIPSPESFTRNILYGQHFYRDEFGVQGTDIILPDCFGFGWTLPTIAAHSGLIGFSTQKLMWREKPFYGDSKVPFNFGLWEGVDGSRIMIVANANKYSTKWKYQDLSRNKALYKLASEGLNRTAYHYYGVGDTGGSPVIESVRAVVDGAAGDGPVEIIISETDRIFKDYLPYASHPELPVWKSELLMDVHATGCYTSQAAMKLYNRRNEQLADAAERSAVIADWSGTVKYPKQALTEAWKRVIWHQFHDDLTGTSIPRAYQFSWNDELLSLKNFSDVLETSVEGFSRLLDTRVKGQPVIIHNPAAYPVTEIVEMRIEGMDKDVAVYDENGRQVPSQVVDTEKGISLLVRASVPSAGYVVYDVRKGRASKVNTCLMADERRMENSVYSLSFDSNGDICSVVDKRNGMELVEKGKAFRLALFTENPSYRWPAWEILKSTVDADPVPITDDVKVTVVENGPVRAKVCVERRYGESVFRQYICLTEGAEDDRIDIINDIDWNTSGALLKAEFPMTVSSPEAVYDLGVGTIARGNNTDIEYEVYAQQWADLTDSDGGYGIALLNDSKYGWDKPSDNVLRLTLLHTPETEGVYKYQDKQDLGRHIFTYSVVGHTGSHREGGIQRKAEVLNQPLKAFVTSRHKGVWGRSFSFVESLNDNVALKALKQAEDSDAYVLRFYETSGKETQAACVRFAADIIEAKELDGNEEYRGEASSSENVLEFEIAPYSMKTFLVRLASAEYSVPELQSASVELPYNFKTASYNAFRSDVNFDGKGNAYPAELFPDTLVYKGVEFAFADPVLHNGVRCRGEKIKLPEGKYDKLYILASAMREDSECVFKVGDKEQTTIIPYYSGFIGQWGHKGHTEEFLKAADVAFAGTHLHSMIYNKDIPHQYGYMFCIVLDIPEDAETFTLPDNSRIVVFAATAVRKDGISVETCSDILDIGIDPVSEGKYDTANLNHCQGKKITGKTGEIKYSERAELAIDGNPDTKWCDVSGVLPKYIEVDLEKETLIKGWSVVHAGMESLNYVTKEFSLQVRDNTDEEWRTVSSVFDNIQPETDRILDEPVTARYVRLNVTKPDQNDGVKVRIYEFSVF